MPCVWWGGADYLSEASRFLRAFFFAPLFGGFTFRNSQVFRNEFSHLQHRLPALFLRDKSRSNSSRALRRSGASCGRYLGENEYPRPHAGGRAACPWSERCVDQRKHALELATFQIPPW